MSWCKKKFWLENPFELFCNMQQIIPLTSMCLYEQMNALSRLTILVFLVVLLSKPRLSFIFLILSLLFIIIVYYIQKRNMEKYVEGYTHTSKKHVHPSACNTKVKDFTSLTDNNRGTVIDRRQNMLWCNDEVTLAPNDPNFVSLNQNLAGPANPKTLIAPVVVPPPAALDYWRANNLINHSHINTESQTDLYLSGYKVSNCCDRIDACMTPATVEHYTSPTMYEGISNPQHPVGKPCGPKPSQISSPVPVTSTPITHVINGTQGCYGDTHHRTGLVREGFETSQGPYSGRTQLPGYPKPEPIQSPQPVTILPFTGLGLEKKDIRENFETPKGLHIRPNESGWVNTTCGYNPYQLAKADLPTNLMAGNYEKTSEMKQFNKNLFMQTIQPDIYTHSEVIEPINSNIGISFTQQFQPTTCTRKDGKGLTYTEHDPRIYQPEVKPRELSNNVTEADVYDPRFSGYGTSYRAYNDSNIGQTRFYYDDVDAVRMPNYITRSDIDFTPYADTYGPLKSDNKFGNKFNSNIRSLAQDTFLRSSLQQRTELQTRLMRKRNNELWQLRKNPIRTMGSFQASMKR